MDLNQEKLTKIEWESTEIKISEDEKEIMKLIIEGYSDVNIVYNKKESLINYLKLTPNNNLFDYLYNEYFKTSVEKISKKYNINYSAEKNLKIQRINSVERVKLENSASKLKDKDGTIFEFILLYLTEGFLKYYTKINIEKYNKYYYTLYHLNNLKITNIIPGVKGFVNHVLNLFDKTISREKLFKNVDDLIEKNVELHDYKDYKLYEHQKQIFSLFKFPQAYIDVKKNGLDNNNYQELQPKLILYTAPTGTGKTLTPLGLSCEYKIIFLCAARHVGLALARVAISMGKKVAFAFGCHDYKDIRLHYHAARTYIKHEMTDYGTCMCGRSNCKLIGRDIKYKNGNKKVDNTDGGNVEIMICDIKSYICAMYYMNSFHDKNEMIMYWDEPTITMDYESHPHHENIREIWKKNIIPNIVLSSATLPHINEIPETVTDYKSRFENSNVHHIVSHDCEKSIPIINSNNFVEMPHFKYASYNDLKMCVDHCYKYMTILRYFDLKEIVKFIKNNDVQNSINPDKKDLLSINYKYMDISEMNMNNIKKHYLEILANIIPDKWESLYLHFQEKRKLKYESNMYVATKDAYTLSDGPTIFLAEDVNKISKFILQTAKIPANELNTITNAIEYNDKLLAIIKDKTKKLEDSIGDEGEKEHKMEKGNIPPEAKKLKTEIDELTKLVKFVELNEVYIPNKLAHIRKWCAKEVIDKEFSCNINSNDVEQIMLMDVDSSWKLLLLMGIGVFSSQLHKDYTEIMKNLASQQKLFMIVAASDYIYGTNYQFCHGYLSKDINNMTQEKAIQAMGRIGRNNKHMDFSIRFRDDSLIDKILNTQENRPEVINMNELFNVDLSDI